jgi:molybdopterin-binding protein
VTRSTDRLAAGPRLCNVYDVEANLTLGEAASAIGVSPDTLRRWDRDGKLRTFRDDRNRRMVSADEVARLSRRRRQRHSTGGQLSARNRMAGVVRSVEVDGVMALVEIEAGPFLLTAAVTRDSVEELGLAPGVEATATVKATSVMVERNRR